MRGHYRQKEDALAEVVGKEKREAGRRRQKGVAIISPSL